jgi:hypothetical protein
MANINKRTSEYRKLLPLIAKASGDVGSDTVGEDVQALSQAKADKSTILTAGDGLTGGGDLSADRTLAVGEGLGISVGADIVSIDQAASLNWTGNHTFSSGVTMNSWLTVGTQLTLNNLVEDVDVELKLKRNIGGDFSLFWNGDIAWTTKIFRPFDLIINRISDTEPATMWAGMVWLDP